MAKKENMAAPIPSGATYHDGLRDTIESIVVAFILAFVFRAFVVEAFVIPTGSMAPGLFGKHAQHRCEMCKYPFAYGIKEPIKTADGRIYDGTLETHRFAVRCPNCGWNGPGNSELNGAVPVIADSGDRILVHKWTYDIGGPILGPKRWDVVVFKNPEDGDQNYIKRLLGLPGEVLEIIDGDLYAAPLESLSPDIIDALSKPPPAGNPSAQRLSPSQDTELFKKYRIQRKTRVAQESLWMIHYDNDFPPLRHRVPEYPAFSPPYWEPLDAAASKAWSANAPLVRFTPPDDKQYWLKLAGCPIQDHYGYNDVHLPGSGTQPLFDVGDVRVRFTMFPAAGDGNITVSLQKGSDEFRVRLAANGQVVLDRTDVGAKLRDQSSVRIELARGQTAPLRADRPIDIEFQNLDYRISFFVNGEEVIATTDEQYHPDLPRLRQRPYSDGKDDRATIKIAGQGMPFELRHLVVHRDVFYRKVFLDDYGLQGRHNVYDQYPGWGTATNPLLLRKSPGEYFCCGDNSPQSKDARLWWEIAPNLRERGDYHFGTVPEDQLIGHAFFVYWPGGLRLTKDTPPIIPNVGKMRIIR
jgi:signal peptidase I